MRKHVDLSCSFCGKTDPEVEYLIVGPGVSICSECVDLCNDILEKKRGGGAVDTPTQEEGT